jgi:hypothetical protein
MSCTTLYHGKKLGSLIPILIFVLLYDVLPLSIPGRLLGIASAIDQQDPASQEQSKQPPPLPTETPRPSSNLGNEKTDSLIVRLRLLEAKLATLSAQYSSDHPDVIDLKQQIADLRSHLKERSESEIHPNAKPEEETPSRQDIRESVESKPAADSGGTLIPNQKIGAEEKAELTETARLLAVLLDSGRIVVGRAQSAINNPRLEDKGFSIAAFEDRLRKEFLTRTGHDLRSLAPAQMPERGKVLLVRLAFFMQKSVHEAQALINQKGIGFKGFIPATFATRVAEGFSKDTGITLRQIGPPSTAPRNPNNKPDEKEQAALLLMQKSHPRIGDHIIQQEIEDRGMRVLLPLFYNKQCLACHGQPKGQVDISGYEKEGFKEGDVGGAISVMVPVENHQLKTDRGR